MTTNSAPATPNTIKERDPDLFAEVREFRARFEETIFDSVENVLDNPLFRDRGRFLRRDDLKAIAQVLRVLTSDSWNEDDLSRFDDAWRGALRSDYFAEAFESIRFRIEDAVRTGRARLTEQHAVDVVQGTLW